MRKVFDIIILITETIVGLIFVLTMILGIFGNSDIITSNGIIVWAFLASLGFLIISCCLRVFFKEK